MCYLQGRITSAVVAFMASLINRSSYASPVQQSAGEQVAPPGRPKISIIWGILKTRGTFLGVPIKGL